MSDLNQVPFDAKLPDGTAVVLPFAEFDGKKYAACAGCNARCQVFSAPHSKDHLGYMLAGRAYCVLCFPRMVECREAQRRVAALAVVTYHGGEGLTAEQRKSLEETLARSMRKGSVITWPRQDTSKSPERFPPAGPNCHFAREENQGAALCGADEANQGLTYIAERATCVKCREILDSATTCGDASFHVAARQLEEDLGR